MSSCYENSPVKNLALYLWKVEAQEREQKKEHKSLEEIDKKENWMQRGDGVVPMLVLQTDKNNLSTNSHIHYTLVFL